jgi:hypothetical protein
LAVLGGEGWEDRDGRAGGEGRVGREAGRDGTHAVALVYIDDILVQELETEINRVGAPLAGLVRSTKADLTLSA